MYSSVVPKGTGYQATATPVSEDFPQACPKYIDQFSSHNRQKRGKMGVGEGSIYHPLPRLLNNDIRASCVHGGFQVQVLVDCLLWIHSSKNSSAYSVNVTSFAGAK